MNKIIEPILVPIKELISSSILGLKLDGEEIKSISKAVLFGEIIEIYFSNGILVKITTDDIPHFYGEGDLEVQIEQHDHSKSLMSEDIVNKSVTNIDIYTWQPKGIFVFKSARYLVQIDFCHEGEPVLSTGFFYMDESTKKMECLITGELAINFNHFLSASDYENHLYLDKIS